MFQLHLSFSLGTTSCKYFLVAEYRKFEIIKLILYIVRAIYYKLSLKMGLILVFVIENNACFLYICSLLIKYVARFYTICKFKYF